MDEIYREGLTLVPVNPPHTVPHKNSQSLFSPLWAWNPKAFVWLVLVILVCAVAVRAQSISPSPTSATNEVPVTGAANPVAGGQAPEQKQAGTITGTIVDQNGTAVAGSKIKLTHEGETAS